MSQFKFFHDNWLDVSELLSNKTGTIHFSVNLDESFIDSFNLSDLKSYRIQAARETYNNFGPKLALCISGGVDSQCMTQCFLEAGIQADVFALKFKDDLNKQDIDHAIKYCDKVNVNLNIIEFDVLQFLSRHNYDYGIKYQSASPHFNVHYKLFDMLREQGYDGVVAGGNTFLYSDVMKDFFPNYTRNALNFINYSNISGFKCQGNFLGYHPKLAWAISILTPPVYDYVGHKFLLPQKERIYWEHLRYLQKIKGYRRAGFNIIPQSQKYTGFELVKKYLENKTGDGWTFEKLYRHPLEKILLTNRIEKIEFKFYSSNVHDILVQLYDDNILPGMGSPSGI